MLTTGQSISSRVRVPSHLVASRRLPGASARRAGRLVFPMRRRRSCSRSPAIGDTVFPMAFLSAVLLWALPGRGRRDLLLWLLLGAAIASCLVVLAGNVRVIDAIGGATWNDAQASQLGPTRPG